MLDYSVLNSMRYFHKADSVDDMIKEIEIEQNAKKNFIKIEIDKRIKSLDEKINKITEFQYIAKLIELDLIKIIKEDMQASDFNMFFGLNTYNMFQNAHSYFNHKDEFEREKDIPEKKERYEECKNSFNFLINQIRERILWNNKQFKLIRLTDNNWSESFGFTYKYKTKQFTLVIPCFESAGTNSYQYYLYKPYMIQYEESEYTITTYFQTDNWHELTDKIKEFIKL